MAQARAYAEPKVRLPGERCWACSACQNVLRDREEVMRRAQVGAGIEVLGGERECLRVVEEREKAAKAAVTG